MERLGTARGHCHLVLPTLAVCAIPFLLGPAGPRAFAAGQAAVDRSVSAEEVAP